MSADPLRRRSATSGRLSINHLIFNAEKYDANGSPHFSRSTSLIPLIEIRMKLIKVYRDFYWLLTYLPLTVFLFFLSNLILFWFLNGPESFLFLNSPFWFSVWFDLESKNLMEDFYSHNYDKAPRQNVSSLWLLHMSNAIQSKQEKGKKNGKVSLTI